jgi:hypothetical protein
MFGGPVYGERLILFRIEVVHFKKGRAGQPLIGQTGSQSVF